MNKQIQDLLPFNEGVILLGYRGSIAHGTYQNRTGIDDKDILGVVIPPLEYGLGIKDFDQKEVFKDDLDLLVYDFRKYIRLLTQNNPNVLSLLWLRENYYILRTELGNRLIDNRNLFLSKLCYKTFTGYAYGQLRRMTHWDSESAYVKTPHMGLQRKEIAEKYGYDTKNASHLIRLLNMAIEILSTGEVNVFREDAQLYISIKNGEWTLQQIEQESDKLFALSKEALINSKLPDKPDYQQINNLSMSILKDYYKIL